MINAPAPLPPSVMAPSYSIQPCSTPCGSLNSSFSRTWAVSPSGKSLPSFLGLVNSNLPSGPFEDLKGVSPLLCGCPLPTAARLLGDGFPTFVLQNVCGHFTTFGLFQTPVTTVSVTAGPQPELESRPNLGLLLCGLVWYHGFHRTLREGPGNSASRPNLAMGQQSKFTHPLQNVSQPHMGQGTGMGPCVHRPL